MSKGWVSFNSTDFSCDNYWWSCICGITATVSQSQMPLPTVLLFGRTIEPVVSRCDELTHRATTVILLPVVQSPSDGYPRIRECHPCKLINVGCESCEHGGCLRFYSYLGTLFFCEFGGQHFRSVSESFAAKIWMEMWLEFVSRRGSPNSRTDLAWILTPTDEVWIWIWYSRMYNLYWKHRVVRFKIFRAGVARSNKRLIRKTSILSSCLEYWFQFSVLPTVIAFPFGWNPCHVLFPISCP